MVAGRRHAPAPIPEVIVIRAASDDPAGVDELVAAIAPGLAGLGLPVINRREVVLVTGPWLAGVSGVRAALAERLPQRRFVETAELGPGDAPVAVVFVVSAATALTESDCVLLDTAAEHTDAVVAVVSKIDVHRGWRDVLTSNRDRLAARASRYARVPWVGAAAAPELGEPRLGRRHPETARRSGCRAAKHVACVGIPASDGRAAVRWRCTERRSAGTGRRVAPATAHGPAAGASIEV